ncbi:MAG: mono/diheme cytochrome c family protein, partial [Rhodothermales bacterium]
ALSAFAAAFLGWCLEESGKFDEDALFWHKWLTIAFMVMTFAAAFWKFRQSKVAPGKWVKVYWAVIAAAGGLMAIGGHHGGVLTHGEFDPPPFLVKEEEKTAYAGDFAEVYAILEDACIECHGKKKQKGKLRVDTLAFCLEGGEEDGPAIVIGAGLKSPLIERIVLPQEDDLVMPPEGKHMLTADQMLILIRWVDAGAPWPGQAPPTESAATEPTPEPDPAPATEPPDEPEVAESANPWALPPPGEEDEDAWDGVMPAAGETVSFREHIWPMIKAKCVKCHREDYVDEKGKKRKAKGELRLDSPDWIKEGGENGDAVVAGKPDESPLYYLLLADAEDDIMPPKGDPLTDEQAEGVHRWIAAGASFE